MITFPPLSFSACSYPWLCCLFFSFPLPIICLLIQLQILCPLSKSPDLRHMGCILLGLGLFPSLRSLYSAGFPTRELGRVQLSEKPRPFLHLTGSLVVPACLCCYSRMPPGGLETVSTYLSHFWRLDVQDQGPSRLSIW